MLRYRRWLAALLALLTALIWAQSAMAITPDDYSSKLPQVLTGDHLYSAAAMLIDAETGEVLLEKNADERMYPASTTKIMTLMLALESGIALDTDIVIPEQAADIPKDSSLVPVYPGDQTTFRDLLFGFMLNSGNDGANAVATLVAGDVAPFVERMNRRAQELGCTNTHFVNPHGYHDENHYTTARDLAIMAKHAMTIPMFQQIVSASRYNFSVLRNRERITFRINNTNVLLYDNSPFFYRGCIGIKTGFHAAAGQCFVAASEREGIRLIAVAMNCEDSDNKWRDTIRMMNYGFTRYTAYSLEQLFKLARPQVATVKISNAISDDPQGGNMDLDIAEISDNDFSTLVRTDNETELNKAVADFIARTEMVITDDMVAPVSQGEIMGSMKYLSKTGEEITALLVASRDIPEEPAKVSLLDIFPALAVLGNPLVISLILVLLALFVLILMAISSRRARIDRRRTSIYKARKREIENTMDARNRTRRRRAPVEYDLVDDLFAGNSDDAEEPVRQEDGFDAYEADEDEDEEEEEDENGFFDLFK